MNRYEKCTAKPYTFLLIDTTLALDNSSRFKKNLLERIKKLIITIDDKIKDENLQYDINREAVKISALLSGKIDKYEYVTGGEILPSGQSKITKQAKCIYSPLGIAFERQTKTIEYQGTKQDETLKALKLEENQELKTIEGLFPESMRDIEINNEINQKKIKIRIFNKEI